MHFLFFAPLRRPPTPTLFPYTTLFRSVDRKTPRAQRRPARDVPRPDVRRPRAGRRRPGPPLQGLQLRRPDRKSTRLNSSHTVTSYAVFCLKKKTTYTTTTPPTVRNGTL